MVSVSEQYVREVKLRRERVSSFDQYPFSLPAVRNLHTLALHPAVNLWRGLAQGALLVIGAPLGG